MNRQIELLPSSTAPLHGIEVKIESTTARPCCSDNNIAILGYAAGPHAASLMCAHCGRHRGWLSKQTAGKIEAIIEKFGRPAEPIILRR
jgi:hypothetical protein